MNEDQITITDKAYLLQLNCSQEKSSILIIKNSDKVLKNS